MYVATVSAPQSISRPDGPPSPRGQPEVVHLAGEQQSRAAVDDDPAFLELDAGQSRASRDSGYRGLAAVMSGDWGL